MNVWHSGLPRRLAEERKRENLNVQYDSPQQSAREGVVMSLAVGGRSHLWVREEKEKEEELEEVEEEDKEERWVKKKKKMTWGGGVPAVSDPW